MITPMLLTWVIVSAVGFALSLGTGLFDAVAAATVYRMGDGNRKIAIRILAGKSLISIVILAIMLAVGILSMIGVNQAMIEGWLFTAIPMLLTAGKAGEAFGQITSITSMTSAEDNATRTAAAIILADARIEAERVKADARVEAVNLLAEAKIKAAQLVRDAIPPTGGPST